MATASPKPEYGTAEDSLRAEVAELKHQLEVERTRAAHGGVPPTAPPSRARLWGLALLCLALIAAGLATGYIPRHRRESLLLSRTKADTESLPTVTVAAAQRSRGQSDLLLPGSVQAIAEAPVLARASGYVKRRNADIGDRVAEGQVLAEIEGPEIQQQIQQARANVEQTKAALEQAMANLRQAKTNEELARVTAQRWSNLAAKGVVSRQENDTYQAQYQAQQANVQAVDKAVAAARSNIAASEANLGRLSQLQSYQSVRAPFAGVITLRNVEAGTLVTEGSTLLYRIAQTGRMRAYVNVAQSDAPAIKVGQAAMLLIPELPGRKFPGAVTRAANALDPATRTMLIEVQAANPTGELLPGMYAQVDFTLARKDPPIAIPSDALVIRGDGPQVAVVGPDQSVHFQRVQVGRDYGDHIDIVSGLQEGQRVAINPSDAVREGARVNPVMSKRRGAPEGKR